MFQYAFFFGLFCYAIFLSCPEGNIILNSSCRSCTSLDSLANFSTVDRKNCICKNTNFIWNSSLLKCVCSNNSYFRTTNNICISCSSIRYAANSNRNTYNSCNCQEPTVWSDNSYCSCPNQTKGGAVLIGKICVPCVQILLADPNKSMNNLTNGPSACYCLPNSAWNLFNSACQCLPNLIFNSYSQQCLPCSNISPRMGEVLYGYGCQCQSGYVWDSLAQDCVCKQGGQFLLDYYTSECVCDFTSNLINNPASSLNCLNCSKLPHTFGISPKQNQCGCQPEAYIWDPITYSCVCDLTIGYLSIGKLCLMCNDSTVGGIKLLPNKTCSCPAKTRWTGSRCQ